MLTHSKPLIFFLFLLLLCSRGLFEILLPKNLAMISQFGGCILLLTWMFTPSRGNFSVSQHTLIVFILLFFCDALISCFITSIYGYNYWLLYTAFNVGIIWLALICIREFDPEFSPLPAIMFCGFFMTIIAILEIVGTIKMPGHSVYFLVRPAASTGSFLHFPILIAIIGYITLQAGFIRKSAPIILSAFFFLLLPFAAFSRSAIFMVGFAVIVFPFIHGFRKSLRPLFMLIFVGLICLGALSQTTLGNRLISRVITATNSASAGNSGRIDTWKTVRNEWLKTNLFVGQKTGEVTNATKNLITSRINIAESSVLQLLINFGLLGTFFFYGIFFQIYRFIDKEHTLLKAIFIAAMAQTCFYQSVEVFPFMVLLMLFPWISRNFSCKPIYHQKTVEKALDVHLDSIY